MKEVNAFTQKIIKTCKNKKYGICWSRQNISNMGANNFEKFKINARKKANLNRAGLKWEHN